jgi:anti-sigma regulatory factor (Ser/Thr protein kinase)
MIKELSVDATLENIGTVTDFVNEQLEAYNCPTKAKAQIDVAIDELFGNIAYYAYDPKVGPATVRVEVVEEPLSVIIVFIDNGTPFNPLQTSDPKKAQTAEEAEIGGLGIYIVKKSMDEIAYEYKDGQNILRIKKNM